MVEDKGSVGCDNFYGYGLMQFVDVYNYFNINGCVGGGIGGGGGFEFGVELVLGQLIGFFGMCRNWDCYIWMIFEGVMQMIICIFGGLGDVDLYVKFGLQLEMNSYDCCFY